MPAEPVDAPWAESAARRLADGDDVRAAFLGLLRDGASPAVAAVAVCVAAGSTHEEAVDRLQQFTSLWEVIQPGEEALGVDLMISHGYFEADVALDARQQAALVHLQAALRSVPGVPSGPAIGLGTRLRTGRLVEAHRQLERLGHVRWPGNTRFWAAMGRAGETLGLAPDQSGPPAVAPDQAGPPAVAPDQTGPPAVAPDQSRPPV
ncbi:hypothetical protein [Actinoplanes sp. CA-252034]|uniref:hypothetical protein n=1 Tax=Actinoplanes sp. CA-252034 TaxID=3239906 RepID=UPI003D96E0FB